MNAHTKLKIEPDFETMTTSGAFCELAELLGVSLWVSDEGKLTAHGDHAIIKRYLADIAKRHRQAIIIALKDERAAPLLSPDEEHDNILADAQALDAAIGEYCAQAGLPPDYRDSLLAARRKMAPYLVVQNLCTFRWWIFQQSKGTTT